MAWIDMVLEGWGTWLRTKGAGQGWGGSLDLDRLWELGGARAPGVHSDPTLCELLATERDDQAPHQRVHRYVMLCKRDEQTTAILRYAGTLVPVDDPELRDYRRWIVSRGALEGCPSRWDMEIGREVWFRETHGLPTGAIAEMTGVAQETVRERLRRVQTMVRAELIQDARARKERATRLRAA